MKKIKISLILNIIITILVTFATIMMFAGLSFSDSELVLESKSFNMFKYFTVDSNILVGIASIVMIVYEILYLKKKIKKIPNCAYVFKHISVVGVTLTFLVTLLFLAPTIESGFLSLYKNSNFFFHLIVPVLSFISYVFYEKYTIKTVYIYDGMLSMVLYTVFYFINVIIHYNGEVVERQYDFYNFLHGELASAIYVIPIMLMVTGAISYGLIFLNKKVLK